MSVAARRDVSFVSAAANDSANFYLLSYPAHAEYPTRMVKFAELSPVDLGSLETCNNGRSIRLSIKRAYAAASW